MEDRTLFVAISVANKSIDDAFWQFALDANITNSENIAWSDPGGYHLTLSYIGKVNASEETRIAKGLKSIKAKPFNIAFNNAAVLNSKHMTVIANPIQPLEQLHKNIEKMRSPLWAPSVFSSMSVPHVTLAKAVKVTQAQKRQWEAAKFSHVEIVDAMHLYESVQNNGKTEYRILESYPFKG